MGQSEQFELPIKPAMEELDAAMVARQPNLSGAIALCVQLSGHDDAEVAKRLGIDKAQWSRIKTGQAHFPQERLNKLMDICGNEAPLIWLAERRGYELKPRLTLMEQKFEAERAARIKAEEQNRLLKEMIVGRQVG